MDGVFKKLQALDLHPKVAKDAVVRTKAGASVSLFAMALAAALFYSEWQWYRTIEKEEFMEVDSIRGVTMRINFDITFPSMPCAVVSLDAMDASGHNTLDILHDVFKQRVDANDVPIGRTEKGEMNKRTKEEANKEKQRAIAEGKPAPLTPKAPDFCGDCYGAAPDGTCCNTCEEVRAAYRTKGWQFNMQTISQCNNEGYTGDVSAQLAGKEGCNIYGHIDVPKVAGNIHFAPGHGVQHAYAHIHDLSQFPPEAFNISHRINSLSFGPYFPGASNLLDGLVRTVETESGMHQFFLKLVPTVYTHVNGNVVNSMQFSVTEHLRRVDPKLLNTEAAQGLLPGVFFNYELSPMRARIEEKRRSFLHFLTRVCAIIGGVFTVMGMVDSFIFKVGEQLNRGKRTGGMLGGLM